MLAMEYVSAAAEFFFNPAAEGTVRILLSAYIWPYFNLLALGTFLLLIGAGTHVRMQLRNIPGGLYWDLIVLTAGGVLWRWFISPRYPQVYFDEINYIDLAGSLRACGRYCLYYGTPLREHLAPFLPAWPFMLSWLGKIGAWNAQLQGAVCLLGASLTVPLSYAAAWRLRPQRLFCTALSALVACWPVHLRISGCSALENGSFVLFLLFLCCLLIWRDTQERYWLWLAGCVWVWMTCWRMENPVIALVLLITLSIADSRWRNLWTSREFCRTAVLSAVLAWPGWLCDLYGVHTHFYLTDSASVQLAAHWRLRVAGNCLFWLNDSAHPLLVTFLAAFSLHWARTCRQICSWTVWFILLNLFYAFIPTADFALRYTCDSWRNSLFPAWGLLVLAAMGLAHIYEMLLTRGKGMAAAAVVCTAAALLLQPLAKYGFIHQSNQLIREFQIADQIGRQIPERSLCCLLLQSDRWGGNISYQHMWAWASGRSWRCFAADEHSFGSSLQPIPDLLSAIEQCRQRGERVYLCLISNNDSPRIARIGQLKRLFPHTEIAELEILESSDTVHVLYVIE